MEIIFRHIPNKEEKDRQEFDMRFHVINQARTLDIVSMDDEVGLENLADEVMRICSYYEQVGGLLLHLNCKACAS